VASLKIKLKVPATQHYRRKHPARDFKCSVSFWTDLVYVMEGWSCVPVLVFDLGNDGTDCSGNCFRTSALKVIETNCALCQ